MKVKPHMQKNDPKKVVKAAEKNVTAIKQDAAMKQVKAEAMRRAQQSIKKK